MEKEELKEKLLDIATFTENLRLAIIRNQSEAVKAWNDIYSDSPQTYVSKVSELKQVYKDLEWSEEQIQDCTNIDKLDRYFIFDKCLYIWGFVDVRATDCPFSPKELAEALIRDFKIDAIQKIMEG